MEVEQKQPIEEQKDYEQVSETTFSESTIKDASVDESKQDWESLKFDITEDECNETNYAEWISSAKTKEYDIDKKDLAELKAYSTLPDRIGIMFTIVYYVLRKKNHTYSNKLRNALLKNTDKFIKDIKTFDYSTLSYKNCVTLKNKLEGQSVEEIKKMSRAGAILLDWAITATKLRIVSGIYEGE